ncbi:MAG: hypothetical protein Athens071416_561 [Parcubacteria group bacterium Athens0714_16]|nr:MAG: hypothetical protein Athens071416_561 [Parcubacteria group bacterium Athens0714_16]
MRKAVNAAIIQNKKILLVKKENTWILPGGKPKQNETDIQCLFRGMKEELPGMIVHSVILLGEKFVGKTPHTGDQIESAVFLVEADGSIKPSAEINDSSFFSSFDALEISEPTKKCINFFKEKGLFIALLFFPKFKIIQKTSDVKHSVFDRSFKFGN